MNRKLTLALLVMISIIFASCDEITSDDDSKNDSSENLYVKFCNPSGSAYTITSIELKTRGAVNSTKSSVINDTINLTSDWGNNILPSGVKLAPGKHIYFTLKLPSGHWAQYRVRVDDGKGNIVMLDYQGFSDNKKDLPITHWGGNDRTVKCYISYLNSESRIWIDGYSDWTGIETDEESNTTGVAL